MKNKVLIILGMHRSGSSLVSDWLNNSGIHLGDRILGANPTNPNGHYEDLDFLEFHESILKRNNLNYKVTIDDKINLTKYDKEKGKAIVNFKNKLNAQWGWKEPRTCLFLDFWKEVIPNAYYLILHRDSFEIMNSLMKRDINLIKNKYQSIQKWKELYKYKKSKHLIQKEYLSVINNYNTKLIDFYNSRDRGQDNIIVVNTNQIGFIYNQIYNKITTWGFEIQYSKIEGVINPNLFTSESLPPKLRDDLVAKTEQLDLKFQKLYTQL